MGKGLGGRGKLRRGVKGWGGLEKGWVREVGAGEEGRSSRKAGKKGETGGRAERKEEGAEEGLGEGWEGKGSTERNKRLG